MKRMIIIHVVLVLFVFSGCGLNKSGVLIRDDAAKESASREPADKKSDGKPASPALKRTAEDRTKHLGKKNGDSPVKAEMDIASSYKDSALGGEKISERKAPGASGLKAGYADDNKQFNYYLHFLKKFGSGVTHYTMNVNERIFLFVKDMNKKPVANADIRIYDGRELLASGRTYADGAFLFFPSEYGHSINRYRVNVDYMHSKKEISLDRQGPRAVEITLEKARAVPDRIPLDIVFIMDTTGSMGE